MTRSIRRTAWWRPELEAHWSAALVKLAEVEVRLDTACACQQGRTAPEEDLRHLSEDLHRIWNAPETDVRL